MVVNGPGVGGQSLWISSSQKPETRVGSIRTGTVCSVFAIDRALVQVPKLSPKSLMMPKYLSEFQASATSLWSQHSGLTPRLALRLTVSQAQVSCASMSQSSSSRKHMKPIIISRKHVNWHQRAGTNLHQAGDIQWHQPDTNQQALVHNQPVLACLHELALHLMPPLTCTTR